MVYLKKIINPDYSHYFCKILFMLRIALIQPLVGIATLLKVAKLKSLLFSCCGTNDFFPIAIKVKLLLYLCNL